MFNLKFIVMLHTDLLYCESCKKELILSHQIKTELGIEEDEKFHIDEIIGEFELVIITNQYKQTYKINPRYIDGYVVN